MPTFDDEEEYPDPRHVDEGDDTMPCPYCEELIHEDSIRCPHCENYLSREDAPLKQPVWIIVGTILALLIALMWALGG
jgi:hypothetical protein